MIILKILEMLFLKNIYNTKRKYFIEINYEKLNSEKRYLFFSLNINKIFQ